FLTRDGRVKVLDFGLARLRDVRGEGPATESATATQVTVPGAILGTPSYMSPEQAEGRPADGRSDLFALGVILYEMLSGRRAFQRPTSVETLHAVLKEDLPDLTAVRPAVPPALARIVARCLAKDPAQRYQSARDLAFHLEELPELGASLTVRATRWRWPVAAAMLATGLAAGWSLRRPPSVPAPVFTRLTFQRGTIPEARFGPDGQSVVYSAAWQGGRESIYTLALASLDAKAVDLPPGDLLAVSSSGELALRLPKGTLARAPMVGGLPREISDHVARADWGPQDGLAVVRRVQGAWRVEFPLGQGVYDTRLRVSLLRVAPSGDRLAIVQTTLGYGGLSSVVVVKPGEAVRVLTDGWEAIDGLAWSRDGREVWLSGHRAARGPIGLYAVGLDGGTRSLLTAPGRLRLLDVSRDGRALIEQIDARAEVRGRAPGGTERDLTWFAATGITDLSADGRTLVLTGDLGRGIGIYSRGTDGSPAVRLGGGGGYALSPDGRTVIARLRDPERIELMPTGAGESVPLPMPGIEDYLWATWFPDGRRILVAASEPGRPVSLYVKEIGGAEPHRRLGPEGLSISQGSDVISPDGTRVAALGPEGPVIVPVEGGPLQPLPGVEPTEAPSAWSSDGRSLYVYVRANGLPVPVTRVDLATGRRERVLEIMPVDPAGIGGIGHLQLALDGQAYVYNYARRLSDLYLVEGLR
ncbi:MAG TPA: protein kinase, partial [Vicinamibacteria bacterium]|nr:protein kinase [Vicinamibacteria bacterium]